MPPSAAVVVPTYNEAANLEPIARAVRSHGYRLVIVDDNSPDGTGDIADELAAADGQIIVIHRPAKQGLGPAYAEAFAALLETPTDIVCQMDADFSHSPDVVPDLIAAVEAGADVAIGSRYVPGGSVPGWPWYRRLLSRWGNGYARFLLGTSIQDMTSGFRAYRSPMLKMLEPATCQASGYGFQVEMALRSHERGLAVVEVPIAFRDRERGESKMHWKIAVEAMWLVTAWGIRRKVRR
ncbi:MAG: polyprenol monophosphomannose synthase [Acidimicrobiia bacterium]|nr:polyprenol monophosphomannose synthase [Acidimicrobiia bacterium]